MIISSLDIKPGVDMDEYRIIRISKKGNMTLPKDIVDELGWKFPLNLDIEIVEGKIEISESEDEILPIITKLWGMIE